jgi:hypothetical protein
LEEARTPAERAKGLMYRTALKANHGMIFIYAEETVVPIWMKNTYIPLDIIWINKDNRIIDIQSGVPQSELIHYPLGQAKYVIELNKNQAEKCKAQLGTKVILK